MTVLGAKALCSFIIAIVRLHKKKKKKKLHTQYIKFGTVLAIGRTKFLLDVILTVGDNGRSQ